MKKTSLKPAAREGIPIYFRASVIARAVGVDKKAIRRRAKRERWPVSWAGNRREYRVPSGIYSLCLGALRGGKITGGLAGFKISKARISEVTRAQIRFAALCALASAIKLNGFEKALDNVEACFDVNRISLRQWAKDWKERGFEGLIDHKRGHSGRKPKS